MPFSSELHITASDVDMFERLRMSSLFRYLQEISIAHSDMLGTGREEVQRFGAVWVLSRIRVQVERMPEHGQDVTLETWTGETHHAVFPRYYRMLSSDGTVCLQASSIWLLMHTDTRRMILPSTVGFQVPSTQLQPGLTLPGALAMPDFSRLAERTVQYSEIDLNGHVNNTRYLDWIDDLLEPMFHQFHPWNAMQINYINEMRPNEKSALHYNLSENSLAVLGTREGQKCFEAIGLFD